jgi:4-amino-4-deoxy-L-arabinose transferase-like glycosyltransferase
VELGPELQTLANRRIEAAVGERTVNGRGGRIARRNSLLDDWIDMRLLGEHTRAVGPLIVFPFILISLMIVARSRLFDNWQAGGGLLIVFAGFVLWSIAVAILLSFGAERARRKSLERMEADLIWLKGAGDVYAPLADQFSRLIDQVRALRQGAFAPFFEQPSVQALLVPLGGAGGIQLVEYLLFAH